MSNSHPLIKGALILTAAGIAGRIIGFFYRIFLSHLIGAEGIGIYQLIFPVFSLCASLYGAGIQTAVSRSTARKSAAGEDTQARAVLLCGILLSCSAAAVLSLLIHHFSPWIAVYWLGEPRCETLLRLLAWAFPFSALHHAISGYYYGKKQTGIPAFSQLLEQLARFLSTWICIRIYMTNGWEITPLPAVIALLVSEIVSSAFCFTSIIRFTWAFPLKWKTFLSETGELLRYSTPVTLNRTVLMLLQSAEASMIPLCLRTYGMAQSGALTVYGVLTGMAMPLVMFPTAITGSFATMLLPSVSEAQALKNDKKIADTVNRTLFASLLLGICCTGLLFLGSPFLGQLLFHNMLAGTFTRTLAFLCPFICVNNTLGSILHGLGKTFSVFWQNCLGLLIRLAFIWLLIPQVGINGYLWGLLASQLTVTACYLITIFRSISPGSE